MAESVLSVCWKKHTSELATVYKNLLENNFLVDCTISAEGQSLKAHRLVLSACSPYFHMLFRKETGQHTFVILVDASFETLHAVIDFVYQGETQIPEGKLNAFLTLAQSLQIKGLNAFSQYHNNENRSNNSTENAFCEALIKDVKSSSLMTSLQEDQEPRCEEMSQVVETFVEHEPLSAELPKKRNEKLDKVNSDEGMTENRMHEMDGRTSARGEDNLNLFSKPLKTEHEEDFNEISHGNVEFSAQEQEMQLSFEASSGPGVADPDGQLLLAILEPKFERLDEDECGEAMDDLSGSDATGTNVGTDPGYGDQNRDHYASAECFPPENVLTTQQPRDVWEQNLPEQQSKSSPPQLQEGPHAQPGEQTELSGEGGMALAHLPSTSTRKRGPTRKGQSRSEELGKDFSDGAALVHPAGSHTLGPFRCDLCGQEFTQSSARARHMCVHTRKRPYRCDVCGKGFTAPSHLKSHMRSHTGERPHRCDVCSKWFGQASDLKTHMRIHTGERPYRCSVCGKRFVRSGDLNSHMRFHTGERPYRCHECGMDFRHRATLACHKRKHAQQHS